MVGDDEESEYEELAFAFFSPVEMLGEPATLKEALESSDTEEWKKAMEIELKSIEENGTWELVELLEGCTVITSKWLFKIKSDADGKIECYKSRLPTTLRTLLVGAIIKGWVVKQMDVTTTFLIGVLVEEIFMAQLEGFDDGSGRVWKLKKALYELKQTPRQWYLKLLEVLEEIGFTPSSADHSLIMLGKEEQRSFMVVYVDDTLIFSPSSDILKEVMLKLRDKFKCRALGDVSFYLGLHIERDVEKWCMRVHQRKYQEALAANFGQIEGHVDTPFPSEFKCVKGSEEESVGEEERRRFQSLVGSLMYAAVKALKALKAQPEVAVVLASAVAMGEGVVSDEAAFRDAVVVALALAPLEVVAEVVVVVALLEPAPSLRASTSFVTALSEENAYSASLPPIEFILASRASHTVLRDASTLTPLPTPSTILGANSTFTVQSHHSSTLPCPVFPSGTITGLHIPSLRHNLVSQGALQQTGVTTIFPAHAFHCDLFHSTSGRFLSRISMCPSTRMYTFRTPRSPSPHVFSTTIPPPPIPPPPSPSCQCHDLSHPSILLHHCLGHPNFVTLHKAVISSLLHGLPPTLPPLPPSLAPPCTVCVQSKLKQHPHPNHPTFSPAPLDLVHMDLWGPNPTPSRQGHRYLLILVDDHSRYSSISLLRTKAKAPDAIIAWATQAATHFGRPIRRLHSYGGGEFLNHTLSSYCTTYGIRHTYTLPHSPQQNGVAESRVREITKTTQCL
ncbi:unnamed protein product [Closterium sp. NIES-53]